MVFIGVGCGLCRGVFSRVCGYCWLVVCWWEWCGDFGFG